MELCATGRPLGAEEVWNLWLVYQICPREELADQAMALAGRLAAGPLVVYAKKRETFIFQGFPLFYIVHLIGIEPTHTAPEAIALSTELQMHLIYSTIFFRDWQGGVAF